MDTLQTSKNAIQSCKKDFDSFIKNEWLGDIASYAQNSLSDRAFTFLNTTLPSHYSSLEQYYYKRLQAISLRMAWVQDATSLELDNLFRAWYSTLADRELHADFLNKKDAIHYSWDIAVPHSRKWWIWTLTTHYPQVFAHSIYTLLSSWWYMMPGNIENRKHFKDSASITDNLAYHAYELDTDNDLLHTRRQWDHKYHTGITWLADILSATVRNYLIGKEKTTVWLYVTAEIDFIKKEAHKKLNELLDWIIHIELVDNRRLEYSVVE